MRTKLTFVRETALARLYMDAQGQEFWVPRSVITHTTKYPAKDELSLAIHEVTIEDWWWLKRECETRSKHDDSIDDMLMQDLHDQREEFNERD